MIEAMQRNPGRVSAGVLNSAAALRVMREIVSDGIRVHGALPHPDAEFMGYSGSMVQVVRDAAEAYGWDAIKVKSVPTAKQIHRSDIVMEWMAALRQQPDGQQDLRRLTAIAYGVPLLIIAGREKVDAAKTIRRRADLSLCWIMGEFLDMTVTASPDVEPGEVYGPRNPIVGHREPFTLKASAGLAEQGKVYIGGVGWLFRGKRWNDGQAASRHIVDRK